MTKAKVLLYCCGLLPTFIIEEDVNCQPEINENKGKFPLSKFIDHMDSIHRPPKGSQTKVLYPVENCISVMGSGYL